jgi:hypothetical protein
LTHLKLRGATVTGQLNLSHEILLAAITLEDCEILSGINVSGATIPSLTVGGSTIDYLIGNGLILGGDLNLAGSTICGTVRTNLSTTVAAAVWLCESRIGGRIHCRNATILASQSRAVHADRMHLGGTLRFTGTFSAEGQIRMIGARIEGSVDLTGAHLRSPYKGVCLDLADAQIDGTLFMVEDGDRGPAFDGRIDLSRARVGLIIVTFGLVSTPSNQETLRTTDATGAVYDPYGVLPLKPRPALTNRPIQCAAGKVRCFRPLEFAVDTVVPLVSFGQGSSWYTDDETGRGRALGSILSVLRAMGWFLASIFALSFARVLRD